MSTLRLQQNRLFISELTISRIYETRQNHKKIPRYDNAMVLGDEGVRLENLVGCALLKEVQRRQDIDDEDFDLLYIRNKDGQEIDFLITQDKRPLKLIEVKWKDASLSPNFKKFLVNEPLSRIQVVGELAQNKSFPGGERIESAKNFLTGQ